MAVYMVITDKKLLGRRNPIELVSLFNGRWEVYALKASSIENYQCIIDINMSAPMECILWNDLVTLSLDAYPNDVAEMAVWWRSVVHPSVDLYLVDPDTPIWFLLTDSLTPADILESLEHSAT